MGKIITFGEALIDFVPLKNGQPLSQVDQFVRAPGGAPANVAVAIAKLGGSSFFAGKIGDDSFGHFLASMFKVQKVHTDYLIFTREAKTALAFVSLKENGERDFLFYRDPSADMLISTAEVKLTWFNEANIFHFGSNTLSYPISKEATLKGVQLARESGTLVSFDPNIRLSLWSEPNEVKEEILPLLSSTDILKVSEEEYQFLLDTNKEELAAEKFLSEGISLVVITKGEKGSSFYTKHHNGDIPVPKVKPIDTTGAGDAFVGGMLYQLGNKHVQKSTFQQMLMDKESLAEILKFANACGAITTTGRGAIPSLPTLAKVKSFLDQSE